MQRVIPSSRSSRQAIAPAATRPMVSRPEDRPPAPIVPESVFHIKPVIRMAGTVGAGNAAVIF